MNGMKTGIRACIYWRNFLLCIRVVIRSPWNSALWLQHVARLQH